ncbi:hypothetical protein D3C85_494390 [compost metagenome]
MLLRHARRLGLVSLGGRDLGRVDLGDGAGGGLLRQAGQLGRGEGVGRERAAELLGVGRQHRDEELADGRAVGEQPAAHDGVQHLVGLVHGRQGACPGGWLGDDAVVGLVQRRHVHAHAGGQQGERPGYVLAQPRCGGAHAVGHQHGIGEERVAAIDRRGVRGVAQVVHGQQHLRGDRAVGQAQAHIVVVEQGLATRQRAFGQGAEAIAADRRRFEGEIGAIDTRQQAVDTAEVEQQHPAHGRVEEAEQAAEFAVEVVVGHRHRAEGEGGQGPAGGLVDAVVVHAQGGMAAAGGGQLRGERPGETDVQAATDSGVAVLLEAGGGRAIGGEHVVGDLQVVAVADEHPAHRVDGAGAVVIDVVAADPRRFDHGQGDAAATDELRIGQQRVGEGIAQVVVQAVVQDHQVAHRVGGTQQWRQREVEQRGVEVGEQGGLRVVAWNRPGRALQVGAAAWHEADAGEAHHRDVVGLDADLMQEAAAARGGAGRERHGVDQQAFVPRFGNAQHLVLRRHVEPVGARRGLDAGHALGIAVVGGDRGVFQIEIDTGQRLALFVLHQGEELPGGGDVDGGLRSGIRRRRGEDGGGLGRGRGRDRVEVAAQGDAIAGAAGHGVFQDAHTLRSGAHMDAADGAVGLLRQQLRDQHGPHGEGVLLHQQRMQVEDLRPGAGIGGVAGRVVVGFVRLVGCLVDEGQQHQGVALDQHVVGGKRQRGAAVDGVQQVQAVAGDLQAHGLGGADRVAAGDHAVVVDVQVAAAILAAAIDAHGDAVEGHQVEVADFDPGAVDEVQQRLAAGFRAWQHQGAPAAAVDLHVAPAFQAQVGAVHAGQQTEFASGRRQVGGGFLQGVEVAEAAQAVAHQEGAAELLVGQRTEALAAVLDAAGDVGIAPAGPVDLGQRHAVVDDAAGRRVVDQHLGVGDLPGAHAEGPVVPRPVVAGIRCVEAEQDAVAQRRGGAGIGKRGDVGDAVPEAEEHRVGGGRRRAEAGGRGELQVVVGIEGGRGAVDHRPGADQLIVLQGLQVELGEAGIDDGGTSRIDQHAIRVGGRVEAATADQPAIPLAPLEARGRAGRNLGDLDAVQAVLEAGIAAAADHRAIADQCHHWHQRHAEAPLGRRVVAQLAEDAGAVLARRQAQQAQAEIDEGAFGGVRAAECRFEQPLRILEAVQGLFRDFQDHRIARAVGDLLRARHGAGQRWPEIARQARHRRQGIGRPARQAGEDAIGPGAPGAQHHLQLAGAGHGRFDPKALRLRGGHRADAGADDVAPGLAVPGQLQQLAFGEVGVEGHAALLVQHAAEVAQWAQGRRVDPAFVLVGVEVQYGEIALHGSPFVR